MPRLIYCDTPRMDAEAVPEQMVMAPTVFIVDDDAAVRSAVTLLVRACGWEARPCASGEEFLQSYHHEQPACVVLDLQMPGMSGADLQAIIAGLDATLPVIIVTAYGDHPLADRARAAGALAIIPKPFRGDELVETIEKALAPTA